MIFLFLGVTTIRDTHVWQWGFILWTCLLCTVVRFAGVYLLTALLNTARIKKISWKEQFILSYGGLRQALFLVTWLGTHASTMSPDVPDNHSDRADFCQCR